MLDTAPELCLWMYGVIFKDYGAAMFISCGSSTGRILIDRIFHWIVLTWWYDNIASCRIIYEAGRLLIFCLDDTDMITVESSRGFQW